MDTNIVQILILLILIQFALGGYYYLLYNEKNKMKKEDELLLQLEEKFCNDNNNNNNKCNKDSLPSISNGFHDNFFKDNNKFLGWRYFYLKNQSNNQIEDDKNFQGTSVRNYLDHLENTQNIITPKQLQVR